MVTLWYALGDRSVPKLTRRAGVGNGLLNWAPSGISKWIGLESMHTDAAWCSACHMYRVCGRKGTSTTELKSTEARQVQQKRMDDSYTVGNDVKPSHIYGDEK